MNAATSTVGASDALRTIARSLEREPGFDDVLAALKAGQAATLDGVRGSSCAPAAAALAEHAPGPLLVVVPHPADIDEFCDELSLFTARRTEKFPAWETMPSELVVRDEIYGDRMRLLKRLGVRGEGTGVSKAVSRDAQRSANETDLIVASIQSLLQPVPPAALLAKQTRRLATGDTIEPEGLTRWLVEQGFENTGAVQLPGEFSLRGGILDLFAPDWFDPVRIEFFGDSIESIRRFDLGSQRSLGPLDAVDVTVLRPGDARGDHLASYLPRDTWVLLVEPGELEEEGRHYLTRVENADTFHTVSDTLRRLYTRPSVTASAISTTSLETTCHLRIESVERFSGDIGKVRGELESVGEGQEIFIICQTEAESQRLAEVFAGTKPALAGRLHYPVGYLRSGFRLTAERIVLISGNELFHREEVRRPSRRRLGRVIDSFLDLREGDYVVHISHGIGKYRGLRLLEKEDRAEEHLELEFDGGTKIFVPASKIDLVQKYVGGAKSRPTLAKIGSASWAKKKESVQAAVLDMASDMLDLQASRAIRPGIVFPDDTEWQREFDAAFPYTETPDQDAAIKASKQDMQLPRPMDRLVCGDVGYGKTEVAMRAAFKAVDAGYQVAVLVPTTVLADQHGRTFRKRMAEFPFQIAVLSRFCSGKEERQILKGMADGSLDIIIGTHRLAQADVRFHNLGLIIIDEEQRFGVEVKEKLKALRQVVDVMTLTATPIPRTLHMSLLGLRDISNLETPPADRLAVETRVTRFSPDIFRHAALRELNRGGQMFFVHNRIKDIHIIADRLRAIVPELRICVGHGQMGEGELEEVMLDFIAHKFDLLLATTIIESGLDIPNANTIFIDEADHYGLADLHQLRGRVGRYKHRAYCYLLLDPNKPLTTTAAKRLAAIEEFSDMGAGFAIAMRDLEIRGAGNILGTEQSGHIATVGYELYCELLEKTVRHLQKLPPKDHVEVNLDLPGEAYLPRRYVSDMRQKIDLYRRLSRVSTETELQELATELVDRFGPRPEAVERLLSRMEIRVLAHGWGIESIHLEDGFVVLGYHDKAKIERLSKKQPGKVRIADARSAYVPLASDTGDPDIVDAFIKSLLRPK
jgi:transcription-repair coupling factor (superfamily II helicase)